MKESNIDRRMTGLVLACLASVTLFVSPRNSVDPINLPKMCLLGVWGFWIAGLFIAGGRTKFHNVDRKLRAAIVIFLLQSLLVLIVTDSNWDFKFYGTPGRNTGFLTYSALTILLVAAASNSSKILMRKYFTALILCGLVVGTYGTLQALGYEIFNYVTYYSNNVFSTFGNSNFHSAFMGIAGAALLTQTVIGSLRFRIRITFILLLLVFLLNIILSSSQGFLGVVGGFLSAMILHLFQNKKQFMGKALFYVSFAGFLTVVLAVFNVGPLAGLIYEASLKARSFYWEAAIRMLVENPIFGLGFDGFGDWYRRTRSVEAFKFNEGVVSDSAHNVPLDIATSGGVVLLCAYLAIQFLVLRTVWLSTRDYQAYDSFHLSLFAAWTAYQIQSLLSINQIGLGIWGWTLSGLLIGFGKVTVKNEKLKKGNRASSTRVVNKTLHPKNYLFTLAAVILGLIISTPPYIAANNFYKALQSGDYQTLQSSAYLAPLDRSRFFNVSLILSENNQNREALKVLVDASKIFPDYYSVWLEIKRNPAATPLQIRNAQEAIQRLDPQTATAKEG